MLQTSNLADRTNATLATVGGFVCWRYSDVAEWVESGCSEESEEGAA